MTAAVGISSRSSSSLFPATAAVRKLAPVMLPPGRLRLATKPSLTRVAAADENDGDSGGDRFDD